jgi:hypothetical protein
MASNIFALAVRVGVMAGLGIAISGCIPFDPAKVAALTMPRSAFAVEPQFTLVKGRARDARQGDNNDYFVYDPATGRWLSAEKVGDVYEPDSDAVAAAQGDLKRNKAQPGGVPKKKAQAGGESKEGGDGGGGGGGGGD